MVATDVASRGIGMIETPPSIPFPAMPSPFKGALLSTLRRFSDCVTLPGLFFVSRFSVKGNLGSVVQHFLLLH